MKTTLFIVSLLLSLSVMAQTKHALVIAIGDYPDNPAKFQDWNDLSSLNDLVLLDNMLSEQKFKEEHIVRLVNQEATHNKIEKAFQLLLNKVQQGDIVYFHFSGHGQQVKDLGELDEEDGFDEALVAYNAPSKWYDGYDGSEHFRDDELNFFINRLREKLGGNGQIIIVLDSCHSGTGSRGGNDQATPRGIDRPCAPEGYSPQTAATMSASDHDLSHSKAEGLANLSSFYGCEADDVNWEYKDLNTQIQYGSLSYFFTSAISQLKENASHRNLYAKIVEDMRLKNNSNQQALLESDNKDELIFNGDFVAQQAYFELIELINFSAKLAGGSLHGLQLGDTIGFFKNDVVSIKGNNPEFIGCLDELKAISCNINLLKKREGFSAERVKYRAFVIGRKSAPVSVRVKVNMSKKKNRGIVKSFFVESTSIQLVEDNYEYSIEDTMINKVVHAYIKIAANGLPLRLMSPIPFDAEGSLERFADYLINSSRAKLFKNIVFNDPNIKIKLGTSLDSTYKNGQSVPVQIINESNKTTYVKLLNISPLQKFDFSPDGDEWIVIAPNDTFEDSFRFSCGKKGDPCGKNQLKLIASHRKIDGLENLREMGSSLAQDRGNGELDDFNSFFETKMAGTRSFGMSNPEVEVQNFFYEIAP